ncbi:MAG TPA: UDP-glucose 4-epimerase [Trinickia sp.]
MSLSGTVQGPDWRVSGRTFPAARGFVCHVRVEHGTFSHEFTHAAQMKRERDALFAGLREGMLWIDHKMSRTFAV